MAERRRWAVTATYEDSGISGAKGWDQRPVFDAMLRDATRRRFDVLVFWSIDRLGRSTAAVTAALADLEAAGVAIYADKEAMDATTPHGRAMLQMAAVFAELERGTIRERVMAGLPRVRTEGEKALGRPKVGKKVEGAIRARLTAGDGMLKVSKFLGVGFRLSCGCGQLCASRTPWRRSTTDVTRAIVPSCTNVTEDRSLTGDDNFDQDLPSAHPASAAEYGIMGLGDEGAPPTAAIANAVHDAPAPLGIEINVTPLTLPPVLAATSLACSLVRGP